MKNDKRQNQRNDLTLEIKERIKEFHQELSPEQIVGVCSKTDCHVCPQSLFINIFGKIKKKGEFVFKSTNNWEKV
jgi:IS30 family transposase